MEPCALVDAGPLVGWFNARDQWHEWSVRVLRQVKGPLHTTEIVLGEALWHLGGNTRPAHALLDLVRRRAVVMLRPWPTLLGRSQELMLKYPLMDAGDASLVALSEAHPRCPVYTVDRRHFSVYRRFRNERIPCTMPA
jgi:predicted nucleic acid-binding protein